MDDGFDIGKLYNEEFKNNEETPSSGLFEKIQKTQALRQKKRRTRLAIWFLTGIAGTVIGFAIFMPFDNVNSIEDTRKITGAKETRKESPFKKSVSEITGVSDNQKDTGNHSNTTENKNDQEPLAHSGVIRDNKESIVSRDKNVKDMNSKGAKTSSGKFSASASLNNPENQWALNEATQKNNSNDRELSLAPQNATGSLSTESDNKRILKGKAANNFEFQNVGYSMLLLQEVGIEGPNPIQITFNDSAFNELLKETSRDKLSYFAFGGLSLLQPKRHDFPWNETSTSTSYHVGLGIEYQPFKFGLSFRFGAGYSQQDYTVGFSPNQIYRERFSYSEKVMMAPLDMSYKFEFSQAMYARVGLGLNLTYIYSTEVVFRNYQNDIQQTELLYDDQNGGVPKYKDYRYPAYLNLGVGFKVKKIAFEPYFKITQVMNRSGYDFSSSNPSINFIPPFDRRQFLMSEIQFGLNIRF